ncbi:MAG: hypothetical protein OEZ36_01550 [Spirochaetota bacterium]|nr:hypothetical protein [Spirochaetota bacterium]
MILFDPHDSTPRQAKDRPNIGESLIQNMPLASHFYLTKAKILSPLYTHHSLKLEWIQPEKSSG